MCVCLSQVWRSAADTGGCAAAGQVVDARPAAVDRVAGAPWRFAAAGAGAGGAAAAPWRRRPAGRRDQSEG